MLERISLAGQWRFAFDMKAAGINYCGGWYTRKLTETLILPGSAVGNKKGIFNTMEDVDNIGEPYSYVGVAWYQRDIDIPQDYAGKSIALILPRTCCTMVWVDNVFIGESDAAQSPQVYNLSAAAFPGRRQLTIRVDNTPQRPANYTLGRMRNGIDGDIRLEIRDSVYIKNVLVRPEVRRNRARVEVTVGNMTGIPVRGLLEFRTRCEAAGHVIRDKAIDMLVEGTEKLLWLELYMGEDFHSWDEFTPNLYDLNVLLNASNGLGSYRDSESLRFGMRSFESRDKQIWCNDNMVFLRGDLAHIANMYSLDYCRQVVREYRDYGINHLRFHTHTPSEELFTAADEAGMYIQVELSCRGVVPYPNEDVFDPLLEPTLIKQGKRILTAFANHPSFVMLSLGNEIEGNYQLLARVVAALRKADSSRLYAQGSNNNLNDVFPLEGDDFFISNKALHRGPLIVRGSAAYADYPPGPVQNEDYPSTRRNLSEGALFHSVPIIAHEVGQYETSPNFDDLDAYPEGEKPKNLLIFKRLMEERGLIDREKDFFAASGQLCVLCYKEDLELTYRTSGFSGFQILALNDCLGQGSSLVGIRNHKGRDKGIVTKEIWRGFCNDRVALILMDKYTYHCNEVLELEPCIVNFGNGSLNGIPVHIDLIDMDGKILERKTITADIPQGVRCFLGVLSFTLPDCSTGTQFRLVVHLEGLDVANRYSVWVFPHVSPAPDTAVVTDLNEAALERLNRGEALILMPDHISKVRSVEGSFASNFWSFTMFSNISLDRGHEVDPGTLGILANTESSLFKEFPTEKGSDWQWWQPLRNSRPVILEGFPKELDPIVSVIDNPMRCSRLALIFEARVGKGRLLFSAIDFYHIDRIRPESVALFEAIKHYVASDAFRPTVELKAEDIKGLLEA
jgi:hypothetical protein